MTDELKVLHRGFDTLDVAFKGAVSTATRLCFLEAKRRAAADRVPATVTINGITGAVQEMGATGGYAFIFDTGPMGEIWTIKDNSDPEQWNIRVSVRAVQLAVNGYEAVKVGLWSTLEKLEARVSTESVSRVDFAVDVVAPGFELRAADFVCHSHAKRTEHSELPESEAAFGVHYAGRRVTGVTVGKQPGRQVVVYDKRREQAYKIGSPWFEIWGHGDKADCPLVWRVEMRAGKEHLRRWKKAEFPGNGDGLTFAQLEDVLVPMFASALQSVRMLAPGQALSNVTHGALHPLWALCRDEVKSALEDIDAGVDADRVIDIRREDISKLYMKQVEGLAASYAVAMGLTYRDATAALADMVAVGLDDLIEKRPVEFRRKFERARDRLSWLPEGGWHGCERDASAPGDAGAHESVGAGVQG